MQKNFSTYAAINTTIIEERKERVPGLWLAIVEKRNCCSKQQTFERLCFTDADKMQRYAVDRCVQLNTESVEHFLAYRPSLLMEVWLLAHLNGYILNRELFREAQAGGKFPKVHQLGISENRFIAVCKVLEKHGIFYRVYGENFVSFIKGI